jgi:hypothetical protein
MKFISPQPNKWYEIFQILKAYAEKELGANNFPPMSLVLSGWTMSNDYDKQLRWEETLKWAEKNNGLHLIPELKEEEKYYVTEYDAFRPYEFHTFDKKYKPTPDEIKAALQNLKKNWVSLFEEDFGNNTTPFSFSGKKSRSLLVSYKTNYLPPWGSWTNHLANGRPSKFTELRIKVNEIIKPVRVDHIIFKEEEKCKN